MIEIWGRPYSSNVIPVIWTAEELGLDFCVKLAGGSFGKLDTPEYAMINPNRMIPTLRDGDFSLWESHVIVRYLCAKYGAGNLCPDDIQQRAIADQWMELAGRDYVIGNTFSMGDIPLGAVAYRYFNIDVERPSLPNIQAWYARLCERPAYKKHVMRFFGTNPDEWQALEVACAEEQPKDN